MRCSLRRLSTFVSKHKSGVEDKEVLAYLKRKKLKVRTPNATVHNVCECPGSMCDKPRKSLADNQWKLYLRREDGAFFCHRCGTSGSWLEFKRRVGNLGEASSPPAIAASTQREPAAAAPTTRRAAEPIHPRALASNRALLVEGKFAKVLAYLQEERGLQPHVLRKYGVGAVVERFQDDAARWIDFECIAFPWLLPAAGDGGGGGGGGGGGASASAEKDKEAADGGADSVGWETVRLKIRALDAKGKQRMLPSGGGWGFFGWHLVPADAVEIVVTEGEYDAMAVYQATGIPAISVPNGCRSLPIDLLPLLERFEKVTLWMDDDIPGREGAEAMAEKLGRGRCRIVDPAISGQSCKDANDALRAGCDMQLLVETAGVIAHERIVTFAELRSAVHLQITQPNQMVGTLYHSMPKLNRILKGHRKGEVSLVTGPTGAGKTTLMSQLSMDLASRGVPTLWGSFEIKNDRLAAKMLAQLQAPPPAALAAGSAAAALADDVERVAHAVPASGE
jgi:twinkle protein